MKIKENRESTQISQKQANTRVVYTQGLYARVVNKTMVVLCETKGFLARPLRGQLV